MKLYSPALVIFFFMTSLWTVDTADRATEHWTKPLTVKEFKAQAARTVDYVYSYNN